MSSLSEKFPKSHHRVCPIAPKISSPTSLCHSTPARTATPPSTSCVLTALLSWPPRSIFRGANCGTLISFPGRASFLFARNQSATSSLTRRWPSFPVHPRAGAEKKLGPPKGAGKRRPGGYFRTPARARMSFPARGPVR